MLRSGEILNLREMHELGPSPLHLKQSPVMCDQSAAVGEPTELVDTPDDTLVRSQAALQTSRC